MTLSRSRHSATDTPTAISAPPPNGELRARLEAFRGDFNVHAAIDAQQFVTLERSIEGLRSAVHELKGKMDKIAWAGWIIAGSLAALVARSFFSIPLIHN